MSRRIRKPARKQARTAAPVAARTAAPVAARAAVMAFAALLASACAPGDAMPDRTAAEASAPVVAPPPVGPARFAFGAPAGAERIAQWDIDVRPDGAGLPPGQGTVSQGAAVFASKCVACHGPTGSEGPYDVLVGGEPWGDGDAPRRKTIGNYWPYATTLYDYIHRAMPQNAPGSLTADETYAVIAWLLARNGILDDDAVMEAGTLPAVRMPARDRFVPDDRRGGPEVR